VLRSEGYSERAIFVIDKKGIIRFIDIHDIDDQPDNEELFKLLDTLEPKRKSLFSFLKPELQPEPDAQVVIYCTPWCPDCIRSRNFFRERGIQFTEVDITKNRDAAARVREWTGGPETTPTFKIKGKVLVGYKKERLEELIGGE
jgi:glutaredoxin